MGPPRIGKTRLTARSTAYVSVVGMLAAVGFVGESPWPILLAAALAVPASLLAVPGYYLVYGLLALIPGANPSSASGSGTVAADGTTLSSASSGSPAVWFTLTTHVLGILALVIAACLNVLLVRAVKARRGHTAPTPHVAA